MRAMRNIRPLWPIGCAILAAVVFGGCSTGTTTSGLNLVDAQGNHPSGWISTHPSFARPDGRACTECHGDNLRGGISGVSCFTASRNGQGCHAGGPAFHPLNWLDKGGTTFHGSAFENGALINNLACTACHDPANPSEPPGFICLDCHFSIDGQRVPAGSTFIHGQITGHTVFFTDNVVNSVCISCHETNNTFGNMPQPFCHNCHEPFPAGFHPTGWANPDAHGAGAKSAPGSQAGFAFCQSCHGTNFTGGGNAPSCLNNAFCHGAGVISPHSPAPWRAPLSARTHTITNTGNAAVCAICHLGSGSVVITAPTPVPPGVTPGCFNNTLCHGNVSAAPHAVRPFPDHPARARNEFDAFCNNCHTINPPRLLSSAPACTECHVGGNPLTVANCATCHGNPPTGLTPVGNAFPNVEGGHAEHNALDNVTGVCGTCHNGGGTGTGLEHFYDNAVDVAFRDLTFKANSGNLLFTAADNTCTNVSCHGGIGTPNWRAGSIDVNAHAGCVQCHTLGTALGNPENNSPFSGRHRKHLEELGSAGNAVCTECHDMSNGTTGATNHFKFLNTPQMEGPAAETVEPLGNPASYNSPDKTCGTFTCHGQQHVAFPWEGSAAAHAVPFLAAAHTSATQADFNGFCGACHAVTGASPLPGAPACQTCHTNAAVSNPLTTKNCTSCHASPPSGAAYANIEGAHGEHVALNSTATPVACGTCHNGLGSETQSHYDRAKTRQEPASIAFTATYNARSGASSFNAALASLSCANVSCHGAQTTPNWRTGAINVNTQCTSCHQLGTGPGIPQYNVYWSGEHDREDHLTAGCTACHNTTTLAAGHFTALSTTAMEGPASATIGGGTTGVTGYSGGTCTNTCHEQKPWQGN